MIASASRKRVELVRNPRFREWSRDAKPDGYPDRIVALFGVRGNKRVAMVKRGGADLVRSSSASLEDLRARLPGQVRVSASPRTDFVFLNTRLPPFDRRSVRRALNLAVDRNELVRLSGGAAAAPPTCQILPPGFPGYSQYCPYAERTPDGSIGGPKIELARRLVARSGTRGMRVVVWAWAGLWERQLRYIVSVLRELGYDAHGYLRREFDYYGRTDIQAGFGLWSADYPSPGGFFAGQLTCAAYHPEASFRPFPFNNGNAAGFCDPAIDRRIRRAYQVQARDPEAAKPLWSEIDRRYVEAAPYVPTVNSRVADLVSKRVGNFQFHPLWGPLFDQMWVE
jgi:peptide/nickel transport system substrate-binding protein